jgi:hypothetical protein
MIRGYIAKPYEIAIKGLIQKQKFEYLLDNYKEIVDLKKCAMKQGDHTVNHEPIIASVRKELYTNHTDNPASGVIKRTIIGNTYYWKDSHDDVHIDGIFTKSIKERGAKKIFHYHDHQGMLTSKVGEFDRVYEKTVLWTDLNVQVQGYTTALMGDSNIQEWRNKSIFKDYLDDNIDQHSVGMIYITMQLAINSDEPAYKENKKEWDQVFPRIGNKAETLEDGYFWSQKEARLIEMSAVGDGSNRVTHTVQNIAPDLQGKDEPSTDTRNNQPSHDTEDMLTFIKSQNFFKH